MIKKLILIIVIFITLITIFTKYKKRDPLPIVAIANYGPHASLIAAIKGFKQQMIDEGFKENSNIRYKIADVAFDPAFIPQMISSLQQNRPKVMLVMSTPIAQLAKGIIHDIPLVYSVITDPVEAGLIKDHNMSDKNMTGSSDAQDLKSFLKFAKSILPNAKRIGLLYSTSESNDLALLNMMHAAAKSFDMSVFSIPVDHARDVNIKMPAFKDKVDLIYVGTSGPIQPTLPTISMHAAIMKIPVFNVECEAVYEGLALASFGVNYTAVGKNAGKLVASLLKGEEIESLNPIYPTLADHHGVISKKKAQELGISIPENIEIVE